MQVNCAVGSSLQSQAQRDPCARSEQGRGKEDHNRRCSAWCLARRSEPRARATPTGDGMRCRWTILCCERTLPVPSPPGWSPASGPKSSPPLTPSTDLACAASECTVTASAADDAASLERCCCSLGADGIWKHSADARSMAATSFCIISAGAQVSVGEVGEIKHSFHGGGHSCPFVSSDGDAARESVSQSVISRSRPALTPPPARSPAPPLPV